MPESRFYEITARTSKAHGRSTVTMRCPFCGCETEARVWSLYGSGKRCDCGARFSGKPQLAEKP